MFSNVVDVSAGWYVVGTAGWLVCYILVLFPVSFAGNANAR